MRSGPRHLFGLLVAALLTAALYVGWLWEPDLIKKTVFADFRILLAVVVAFAVLSFAQWVADRVPGDDASDHPDEDAADPGEGGPSSG